MYRTAVVKQHGTDAVKRCRTVAAKKCMTAVEKGARQMREVFVMNIKEEVFEMKQIQESLLAFL